MRLPRWVFVRGELILLCSSLTVKVHCGSIMVNMTGREDIKVPESIALQ